MKKATQFRPDFKRVESGLKFNGRAAIDRMYDHVWEQYRATFLKHNPTCYACGSKSSVVDHLTPHKGDEILFKKTDNHIPLCNKCHNTVTSMFDRKYVRKNPITPKLTWLAKMRIDYQVDVKVKVLPKYGPT